MITVGEDGAMRDEDWVSLVASVRAGDCTLMLGPAAVSGMVDGVALPLQVAMASHVKDKLVEQAPGDARFQRLDPRKPGSVAQAAINVEDPAVLQAWVSAFYETFPADYGPLRDLASLPFELVINTSPGLAAEQHFRTVKPQAYADFYDRTGPTGNELPEPTESAPIIYNLYGSLDRPSSLILSDSDRLDFIVSVVSDEPRLPRKLKTLLQDRDRSLLFVGFELVQWQFRLLLHVLSGEMKRRKKSFALEPGVTDLDLETTDFYRDAHKIHFVAGDPSEFVRTLTSRVGASPTPDHAGTPVLPPGAPIVFISHASEDQEAALDLAEALHRHEIGTWLDRNQLRGGDGWNDRIKDTLQSVDYVVVLQSENLRRKDEGYVNREIAHALDRNLDFRPPRRFLIPVVVDSADNVIAQLDHLHAVDLTRDGTDELVKIINRDQNFKDRQT